MLAGSFVIPVVGLLCTGRFRAWGVARALAVALLGVLAALQCVYMVAHFMHVAPFQLYRESAPDQLNDPEPKRERRGLVSAVGGRQSVSS